MEGRADVMGKSQTGFGNTVGSLGGLPSSSLKGKLATLEVHRQPSTRLGRSKEDMQRD